MTAGSPAAQPVALPPESTDVLPEGGDLPVGPSDAELLAASRTGDAEAYGELFRRHAPAARALARHLARNDADADDLVSEAFTKVLNALQNGNGPTAALRPYLLTAVRRVHVDRAVAGRRVEPVEDIGAYDAAEPFVDPALAGLERTLVARAYSQLPERWQAVLWHSEVEGMSPRDIAPLLGMSPNAVSALAVRARSGLRDAYLAAHLPDPQRRECEKTLPRLAAYVRGSTSAREGTQIATHLDACVDCRAVLAELRDVGVGMRAVIGPLVLGLGAPAYLAQVATFGAGAGGTGASTASVVSSGGAATGGAGSASAASGAAAAGSASGAVAAGGSAGTSLGSVLAAAGVSGWALTGVAVLVAGAVTATAVAVGGARQDPAPAAVPRASSDGPARGGSQPETTRVPEATERQPSRPVAAPVEVGVAALDAAAEEAGAAEVVAAPIDPAQLPGPGAPVALVDVLPDDAPLAEEPPVEPRPAEQVPVQSPVAEPPPRPGPAPVPAPEPDPAPAPEPEPAPPAEPQPAPEPEPTTGPPPSVVTMSATGRLVPGGAGVLAVSIEPMATLPDGVHAVLVLEVPAGVSISSHACVVDEGSESGPSSVVCDLGRLTGARRVELPVRLEETIPTGQHQVLLRLTASSAHGETTSHGVGTLDVTPS